MAKDSGGGKIAVAVVHGVGKQKSDFADELIKELTKQFVEQILGNVPNPHTQIIIEPIHWAPKMQ